MAIYPATHTQEEMEEFASAQWDKTLAYLQGTYSLSRPDCEDIFQEAFFILYTKLIDGNLTLSSSLSTFFLGICKNKAHEKLRANGRKELNIIDEFPQTSKDEFEDERIDRILALENDTEQTAARKDAVVRQIVSDLPAPCDHILWGYYRDGFSMKTLALMHNYKSEGSVKVTKHRCTEKFKVRFLEMSKRIFD